MTHLQRFYVRIIADRRWTDTRRLSVGRSIAKALETEWTTGQFPAQNCRPFNFSSVNVFAATPPTPRDGQQARREGWLFEENPYAPGSPRYEAWARAYAELGMATFTFHFGPSPLD